MASANFSFSGRSQAALPPCDTGAVAVSVERRERGDGFVMLAASSKAAASNSRFCRDGELMSTTTNAAMRTASGMEMDRKIFAVEPLLRRLPQRQPFLCRLQAAASAAAFSSAAFFFCGDAGGLGLFSFSLVICQTEVSLSAFLRLQTVRAGARTRHRRRRIFLHLCGSPPQAHIRGLCIPAGQTPQLHSISAISRKWRRIEAAAQFS